MMDTNATDVDLLAIPGGPASGVVGEPNEEPNAVLSHGRRITLGWWGIVTGIVLIAAALLVTIDSAMWVRLAAGALGAAALYRGIDDLAQGRWGPTVQTGKWLAIGWLALVVFAAVFADLLPLTESRDPSRTFHEPVLATPDLLSRHPLGTDRQGLDVLGGIIYGFRVSLVVGLGTAILGIIVGGTAGLLAGYFRGAADRFFDLIANTLLAVPPLVLLLAAAAVLSRNVWNITLVLAIISIPTYLRLARANALMLSQRDFVLAAKALGTRSHHILLYDLAPRVLRVLLSYAFVMTGVVVVAEASLSFLGLGIPRPEPTIGNMISASQHEFEQYPYLVFLPAAALFLTVLSLNRLGEARVARSMHARAWRWWRKQPG